MIRRAKFYAWTLTTLLALAFGLVSTASADDAAPGKGTLILTMEAPYLDGAPSKAYKDYFLRARRRDNGKEQQFMYFGSSTWVASPNDLAGGEGAIFTKALEPGDWELYLFQMNVGNIHWRPAQEFSIPFTIKPGRATYIGAFLPLGHTVKSTVDYAGGAHFVVTDRSARDIPIVTAKTPNLGPVDVEVFNVDTMHNPLFSGTQASEAPYAEAQFCRYMNLLGCGPNPL